MVLGNYPYDSANMSTHVYEHALIPYQAIDVAMHLQQWLSSLD
jgi:hypothetical protein